ncbi:MAG TPA: hypothetical protein VE592_06890 [Geminicoccaceae bacterium]|jgi:hypothetical protein|nr:hypothetical protein [Geminicoccaceae bacterium]
MHGLEPLEDDAGGTVFRDVVMLALAGFVVVVIMLLPHLNPPGAKTADDATPPGNVIVEVRWPDEIDADVDLWVQAPGDIPVGYSNKGGAVFNLLRDDLGSRVDVTGLNYETSYSRGVHSGEYTVNLHLYRNPSNVYPIPATVVTSVKRSADQTTRQLLASKVLLAREGEEMTVYRFHLSEAGALVAGSVHSLHKPLRAGRKS